MVIQFSFVTDSLFKNERVFLLYKPGAAASLVAQLSSIFIAAQPQIKETEFAPIATSDAGWLRDLFVLCKFTSAINYPHTVKI